MHFTSVSGAEFAAAIHAAGQVVPIEQSPGWAAYDDSLPGRAHWRFLLASTDEGVRVAISLTAYAGRFLTQLWAKNGPVWLGPAPTPAQEAQFRAGLCRYVRTHHRRAALVRLHAHAPAPDLHEPLISVFYDHTVVLDLSRSEEQLLADMSKSGRRDLRYGLANEDLVFAEETSLSEQEFDRDIYAVFAETARRGGFHLRPSQFYYQMLTHLAPACRLFTIRRHGQVLTWALVTSYDTAVNYYFAASTAAARDTFASYRQVWEIIRLVKAEGARTFDFLGTGSARAPGLASLDGFKLKFTKSGAVQVPGPWDLHVRPTRVRAVLGVRRLGTWVRSLPAAFTPRRARVAPAGAPVAAQTPAAPAPAPQDAANQTPVSQTAAAPAAPVAVRPGATAPAVLPVVLDYSLSGYALARAFHAAYGLKSVAVVPFTTGATKWSSLFSEHVVVGRAGLKNYEVVLDAIRSLAARERSLTVIPLTNNDAYVHALAASANTLGSNVIVPHESPAKLAAVADKASFARICARVDVATPASVELDFGAATAPDAAAVPFAFPLIVKPADSGAYNALTLTGKKKLYHLTSRAELSELIERFRAAGFQGTLLAQDLIPGEEIYSVTAYRTTSGEITLMRTARVLLQDPRPAFLGIPDAHIVTDILDLAHMATRFLQEVDWHGFANFDAIYDPRAGRYVFFEVNPRYGRNCHYATATGANVARQLVGDLIAGQPVPAPKLPHDFLYTVLPPLFVQRAMSKSPQPELAAQVRDLRRARAWSDPLKYRGETSWRHHAYAIATAWNHARTYRRAARPVG